MSGNYWTTDDDIQADLRSISDFCDASAKSNMQNPSSHARKARTKPSIYDDVEIEGTDSSTNQYKGRGFSFDRHSLTPGLENSQWKEIREVSGYGFSNKLIECALRNEVEGDTTSPTLTPNIQLGSHSSASSSSSPVADIIKTSQRLNSGNDSKDVAPALYDIVKSNKPRSNKYTKNDKDSTVTQSNFARLLKQEPVKSSDLKSFKDTKNDKDSTATQSNLAHLLKQEQAKSFDLKSHKDFPAL